MESLLHLTLCLELAAQMGRLVLLHTEETEARGSKQLDLST